MVCCIIYNFLGKVSGKRSCYVFDKEFEIDFNKEKC